MATGRLRIIVFVLARFLPVWRHRGRKFCKNVGFLLAIHCRAFFHSSILHSHLCTSAKFFYKQLRPILVVMAERAPGASMLESNDSEMARNEDAPAMPVAEL